MTYRPANLALTIPLASSKLDHLAFGTRERAKDTEHTLNKSTPSTPGEAQVYTSVSKPLRLQLIFIC